LVQAKKEVGSLTQQFTQLSCAWSGSDKKIADLEVQLPQTNKEVGSLRKQFLDEQAKSEQVADCLRLLLGVQYLRLTKFQFTSNPLGGLFSHLTAKCGGNVHEKGAVEFTANCIHDPSWCHPRNVANFRDNSLFHSKDEPGVRVCCDFKALRIYPTQYTLQTYDGSCDGASWMEIDRRENNGDLNASEAVKTFAVARSGLFRMIHLRQTGPNYNGNNYVIFCGFEVFGTVVGLQ
jgi:hypothetical protein